MLDRGELPADLDELGGSTELQPCYGESYIAPGEVFTMFWQGGGGYGDPLTRDPEEVARDVREDKVHATPPRPGTASSSTSDGGVDEEATRPIVGNCRDARRARSTASGRPAVGRHRRAHGGSTTTSPRSATDVACVHCATVLGTRRGRGLDLVGHEGPVSEAGPQVISPPGST